MTENKSDLNYWVFNKEYPLHSNAAILNVGSAGTGKSFFTYRVLLPIYIKEGGIKTLLICSRTGKFDYTTATELEAPIYKDVLIYFIKIEESNRCCQMLRADAIINEYWQKIMAIKDEDDLIKIRKDLLNQCRQAGQSEFETIKMELDKLLSIIEKKLLHMTVDDVKDFAQMRWDTGTKLTYNPTLIVFDDMSGTDAFIKPYSDVHKLIYCRRHLHLTMIMLVQSLTTVSTNIRRNCTEFICFSTMSEADAKLLKNRIPITWTYKELIDAFIKISNEEERNDKMLTLFTVFPNQSIVIGAPPCIRKLLP